MLKVSTFDGVSHTLKIGQLDNHRHPASVAIEGTPKREFEQRKDETSEAKASLQKSFAEEMKRVEKRVVNNKTLQGHVLPVAKDKLADALKSKGEFLDQKKDRAEENLVLQILPHRPRRRRGTERETCADGVRFA